MQIDSIYSRLTPEERVCRDEVMAQMIMQRQPVDVAAFIGTDPGKRNTLSSLIDKKVLVVGDNGCINFSYPVSALPSNHRVTLADGRWFYAMCAVDALGSAFAFGQDVKIASKCHHCQEPVEVHLQKGEIASLTPQETRVLHVDLNKYENWAATC